MPKHYFKLLIWLPATQLDAVNMQMLINNPANIVIQAVSENRLVGLVSSQYPLVNFQTCLAAEDRPWKLYSTAETQFWRWLPNVNGALWWNILVNRQMGKQEKCSPAYHREGIQYLILNDKILDIGHCLVLLDTQKIFLRSSSDQVALSC